MNTAKQQTKKIPRPMNCFLAFRLEKQGEILVRCPGANHRDISKIIAKWWKETPEHEKEPYREKARLSKIEHAKLHPGYKYSPNKRPGHKPRKYVRRVKDTFTSRSAENNRLMKLLYTDPKMFEKETIIDQSSPFATNVNNVKQEIRQYSFPACQIAERPACRIAERPACEVSNQAQYNNQLGFQNPSEPLQVPNYSFTSISKDALDQAHNSFVKDETFTQSSGFLDCSIPTPFYQNLFIPTQPEEYFYMVPFHQQAQEFSPLEPPTTTPVYSDNSPSSGSSVCFSPLEYTNSPPIPACDYPPVLDQYAFWPMLDSEYSPNYLTYSFSNDQIATEAYIDPSLLTMPSAPPRDLSYVSNQDFDNVFSSAMFPF